MKRTIQILWAELRPYKGRLFFSLFLGILVSASKSSAPPILNLLQKTWEAGDKGLAALDSSGVTQFFLTLLQANPEAKGADLIWKLPLLLALLWIFGAICRYFHMLWMLYISELVAVNLRRQLMDKYLSLNLSFFQNFSSGSGGLMSRMLNDILIVQDGSRKLADVIREPFTAFFSFSYLIYLDWQLTFFILIALPIITWVLRKLAQSLKKYGHLNQQSMEDLSRTLKESIDGTRIVQSFNLQNEMRQRFDRVAQKFLDSKRKILSREEAAGPSSESLAALTLATILVYFGQKITQGQLTIGDFLAFSFAIGLLQDSIKKVQGGYIKIQQTSVALERMYDILNLESTVPEVSDPKPFPADWQYIEFKDVSFSYGERSILNQINLKVKKGEVIAFVGSSGGGKSTLANLLARFFDPASGQIFIDETPINEFSLHDLRANIALVSQDVFLFSDSIEKNIHAGDFAKPLTGVEAAAKTANAHNFILQAPEGYQSRVGDIGGRLSGGEKQRISIARAMFKDAPILVLDEATSALDSESELEVQQGLDSLMKGRTAFVIAHRLSTISKADRIVVLGQGQILEEGTHKELLAKGGEYHRFFQLQARL